MPNTKITKQKVKDHLSYSKRLYIFGMIAFVGLASLLFTVTRYQSPNDLSVDIALVDSYADISKVDDDIDTLLSMTQEYDPALEKVAFMSIAYEGDSSTEDGYYGAQQYMVQLYAGDNDIFIQNELLTDSIIAEGAALALEELEGFEDFVAAHPDVEILWAHEPSAATETDEDEGEEAEAVDTPLHAYAIDMSSLLGFNERGAFDIREKYACILISSENPETSLYALDKMFTVFAATPVQETEEAIEEEAAQ